VCRRSGWKYKREEELGEGRNTKKKGRGKKGWKEMGTGGGQLERYEGEGGRGIEKMSVVGGKKGKEKEKGVWGTGERKEEETREREDR